MPVAGVVPWWQISWSPYTVKYLIWDARNTKKLKVYRFVLYLPLCNILESGVKSRMKMQLEQRRQAMLQLHLNGQQFYCLIRCDLFEIFYRIYNSARLRCPYMRQWITQSLIQIMASPIFGAKPLSELMRDYYYYYYYYYYYQYYYYQFDPCERTSLTLQLSFSKMDLNMSTRWRHFVLVAMW